MGEETCQPPKSFFLLFSNQAKTFSLYLPGIFKSFSLPLSPFVDPLSPRQLLEDYAFWVLGFSSLSPRHPHLFGFERWTSQEAGIQSVRIQKLQCYQLWYQLFEILSASKIDSQLSLIRAVGLSPDLTGRDVDQDAEREKVKRPVRHSEQHPSPAQEQEWYPHHQHPDTPWQAVSRQLSKTSVQTNKWVEQRLGQCRDWSGTQTST